jgi:hypothetical protein
MRRAEPVDVMGTLYSSDGLRFGGYRTQDFLDATEELEATRQGVRGEIVTEAKYCAVWLRAFAELCFLGAAVSLESLILGSGALALGYTVELVRCYVRGPFYLYNSSLFCRGYVWLRIPAFILAFILTYAGSKRLAVGIAAFFILESWGVITTLVGIPIRLLVTKSLHWLSGSDLFLNNPESFVVSYTIKRWRKRLDLG